MTPDGKCLFFSSMTRTLADYSDIPLTLERKLEILSQPGHGSEDVFSVDARIIEDLRPDGLNPDPAAGSPPRPDRRHED